MIECLETRVAPALILNPANPTIATWTDVDGDLVTLRVNKPILDIGDFVFSAVGLGEKMEALLLGDDNVPGLNITITAKPQNFGGTVGQEGDGLVNLGRINAEGMPLGKVVIDGDLGEIDAGNGSGFALKSFTAGSMGERGLDTGAVDLESRLQGNVGSFKIRGNVRDAFVSVVDGSIGSVTVGGSLIGGSTDAGGHFRANGAIGPVKIAGDIIGGSGNSHSGGISSSSSIASVTVGGSLIGGSGQFYSGSIDAGTLGPVRIGGDVVGGGGALSGAILARSQMGSVTIGGSVIGGTTTASGAIASEGDTGDIKIAGNLIGAIAPSSGMITVVGSIKSVTIGGSIIAAPVSAPLGFSGGIIASDALGPVKVTGSLLGNELNHVLISARGQANPGGATDVALKSLTVGGRVERTEILIGYFGENGQNADAQAGPIRVGGDWISSDLVAGVAATNGFFGDATDTKLRAGFDYGAGATKDISTVHSRIASITIRGAVYGTGGVSGVEHFGFVAEEIGSFKTNGSTIPLKAGSNNDTFALNNAQSVGSGRSTGNGDGFAVHVAEVDSVVARPEGGGADVQRR